MNNLKKYYAACNRLGLSVCVVLAFCTPASNQTKAIDSLLHLLKSAKNDTGKMYLNFQVAEQLKGYNLSSADKYLEAGYTLARAEGDTYNIAYYLQHKGGSLFDMAQYNQSELYYDSAITLYNRLLKSGNDPNKSETYTYGKIDCLAGKGLLLSKIYQYQESINYYLLCIDALENASGSKRNSYLASIYNDIASDYYEMEEFDNALKYDKQGLPFTDINKDEDLFVVSHLFVADDYSALSSFDSSSAYLESVRPLVKKLNKPSLNIRFYYILGGIYRKQKEWNAALTSFEKAKESAKKIKDDFQVINSEEGISFCLLKSGMFDKARQAALHVLTESTRLNIPLLNVQALELLTDIEERSGNVDKAFQYQKQYISVSDSVKKEKVQRLMHETEAKYQSAKKEKEILALQKNKQIQLLSIKQKSTLNYFLIASVAALLLVVFLIYRNLRHRGLLAKQHDELQQQHIRELEKDKQLVAVDSMLKGQEDERTRLAKDLHDGLGGMLSGVKFSLINMKSKLINGHENAAVFDRSLDMLDISIKELRRVAHNMMPEALAKFGLNEALKDYCTILNNADIMNIRYQSFGMEQRIENRSEIIIYRIIQELLNNIFKHAKASEVLVQLLREETRLSITIEDNGKGFDLHELEKTKGAGWANIRSRIDYLKGRLDLHSDDVKGTSVNIECLVTN